MTLKEIAEKVAGGTFKKPEDFISFLAENQIDMTVAGAPIETGADETEKKEEEEIDKEDEPSKTDGSLMNARDKAAEKAFAGIGG